MIVDPGEYVVFFSGLDIIVPRRTEHADFETLVAAEKEPFANMAWLCSARDDYLTALFMPLFAQTTPSISTSRFQHGDFHYVSISLDDAAADRLLQSIGCERYQVRQLLGIVPSAAARFLLKAHAHAHWAEVSRYCGACGSPLTAGHDHGDPDGKYCPSCKRFFFPKISPAVIVLIHKGNSILLAHNRKFASGRFGLIAGFVEMGETLEETVHREVMEEAGITVHKLRYVKSQPWPFPDSLMIAFEAEYESGTAKPDGVEIDQLGWFTRENLPEIPPRGSVARFLIERFLESS